MSLEYENKHLLSIDNIYLDENIGFDDGHILTASDPAYSKAASSFGTV